MKPLAFLKARRTAAGDLVLDNTAPYPLHDLWCVDHTGDPRTGKAPRLARVPLVPVGTKEIVPEWRAVPDADWPQATAEKLAADRDLCLLAAVTERGELVQVHDDREIFQTSPNELPAIDIHSL